jgi:hypothetical protein
MTPTAQKIYNLAKANLGCHITLDDTVPHDVGCAEAVSYILKKAGVQNIPILGIAGTATLFQFLSNDPQFKRIYAPEKGAIIISATGQGNGSVQGHTGILGGLSVLYWGDYGICLNNSDTGLFLELSSLRRWRQYYGGLGGLPVAFFRAL